MTGVEVRVLLVVDDPQIEQRYRHEIERLGAQCDAVPDVARMQQCLLRTRYQGLLLDVPTAIRAGAAQVELLQQMMDWFPTMRLLWDAANGTIRTMLASRPLTKGVTLERFLCEICPQQTPRTMRLHLREPCFDRILLAGGATFSREGAEETFLLNLSLGGCFVVSRREWTVGATCWICFSRLDGITLEAVVRRYNPWVGPASQAPGIGVQFTALPESLEHALFSRFR